MRRNPVRLLLVAGVLAIGLALAPAGLAGAIVDRAAQSLADDPVYVDPEAKPTLTPAQEAELEAAIADRGGGPIYVAVLPDAVKAEVGGNATDALRVLATTVGAPGVYAIVAGGQFRAGSTGDSGLARGEAAQLATAAFGASGGDGLAATLDDFAGRVGEARSEGSGVATPDDGGGGGFRWLWVLIVAAVAVLFGVRLRRRHARAKQFAAVKEAAREDLVTLAGDVAELEDDVERDPDAKDDYLLALEQYSLASERFDRARTPQELEPVAKALDEGRYLMTRAKARIEGRALPDRRLPCFFDPRHGPSVKDVLFAPPGGEAREVPVCAADAVRLEQGEEPQSRLVQSGGQMVPYWSAPSHYGSYFGGFVPGLVAGSLISGGWDQGSGGQSDDSTRWGSGDFGGGGGGDFGGGGDSGGGDSGGGGGDF